MSSMQSCLKDPYQSIIVTCISSICISKSCTVMSWITVNRLGFNQFRALHNFEKLKEHSKWSKLQNFKSTIIRKNVHTRVLPHRILLLYQCLYCNFARHVYLRIWSKVIVLTLLKHTWFWHSKMSLYAIGFNPLNTKWFWLY